MYRGNQVQRVLKILAKNVKDNDRPNLMASDYIADELQISLAETKQLLRNMNQMGVIECNMDVDFSLITQQGFNRL